MLQLLGSFFIISGMITYTLKDDYSKEAVLPLTMCFTLMGLALLMYKSM